MHEAPVHTPLIVANETPSQKDILTPEAITFLTELHVKFNKRRLNLLKDRIEAQNLFNRSLLPRFPPESEDIRRDPRWYVQSCPPDLKKRWIEITGPTDKKMVINALNSEANTFMADFEDANCPTWENLVEGQNNLKLAVRKTLSFQSEDGKKEYKLKEKTAVLMVRPRGWHLPEKHFKVDGELTSGSLFDFGLYFFHNAKELLARGSGPYYYLPKIESYHEAKLWADVFDFSEDYLKLERGKIKATVLIETLPAAFQMDEILFVLREHSVGLNAGRWDYIFSIIKKMRMFTSSVFPDRQLITMGAPFMQSYTNLLIQTCHKRHAHAIGGMSAFIPSRKDQEVNKVAFAKVHEDKAREAGQGFDGAWIAHPDLTQIAREPFEKKMQERANQILWPLPPLKIRPEELLNFKIADFKVTEAGFRSNIYISIRYLAGWLSGVGAQAIHNLMEDAATAEISRAQLWQWLHRKIKTDQGKVLDAGFFLKILKEESNNLQNDPAFPFKDKIEPAKELIKRVVLETYLPDFLTLAAYEMI